MTIKYVFAHCGCSCQFIYEIILFSLMHVWICAFINEFWHAKTPAALYCDLEVVPWYFCSPGLWVRSKPKVFAPKKLPTNLCKPILPIESNYAQTKQKKNSSLPVLQLLVLGVLQQHRCQWLNGVSLGGTSPVIIWYPTWLWLTVCHGFSMALIEIDGLPNFKMGGYLSMVY